MSFTNKVSFAIKKYPFPIISSGIKLINAANQQIQSSKDNAGN